MVFETKSLTGLKFTDSTKPGVIQVTTSGFLKSICTRDQTQVPPNELSASTKVLFPDA